MLRDTGISPGEAHTIALSNLAKQLIPSIFSTQKIDGKIVALQSTVSTAYTASRILMPDLHEQFVGLFGSSFLVAVPGRDSFFPFAAHPKHIIDYMSGVVKKPPSAF